MQRTGDNIMKQEGKSTVLFMIKEKMADMLRKKAVWRG